MKFFQPISLTAAAVAVGTAVFFIGELSGKTEAHGIEHSLLYERVTRIETKIDQIQAAVSPQRFAMKNKETGQQDRQ